MIISTHVLESSWIVVAVFLFFVDSACFKTHKCSVHDRIRFSVIRIKVHFRVFREQNTNKNAMKKKMAYNYTYELAAIVSLLSFEYHFCFTYKYTSYVFFQHPHSHTYIYTHSFQHTNTYNNTFSGHSERARAHYFARSIRCGMFEQLYQSKRFSFRLESSIPVHLTITAGMVITHHRPSILGHLNVHTQKTIIVIYGMPAVTFFHKISNGIIGDVHIRECIVWEIIHYPSQTIVWVYSLREMVSSVESRPWLDPNKSHLRIDEWRIKTNLYLLNQNWTSFKETLVWSSIEQC